MPSEHDDEPIPQEEVSTDQESKEVRLGHAVEAFGGSARELLATMLDQDEFKSDSRFGDLISELRTRLEQEQTEARDPFDVEWIGKDLVGLDSEKLAMLKKKEFRDYAAELKSFAESGDVAKDDKGKLFLALEEVARLTDVKEVSKRKDLFEGIKYFVEGGNFDSLSRDAVNVLTKLDRKGSLVKRETKDVVRNVLIDALNNNSELFEKLQRNLGGTQLLYGRHVSVNEARDVLSGLIHTGTFHFADDRMQIVGRDGRYEISGESFNEIKKRSQEIARELLPVLNYYLACRPERHGMVARGTLSNLSYYQQRLNVTGILQDKPFFDLYEEDGVVLSGLESSEAINKMAEETNRVGNADFEVMYKPMYQEQIKKQRTAEFKRNVLGEGVEYRRFDEIWAKFQQLRYDQRQLNERELGDYLDRMVESGDSLFLFLQSCVKAIKNRQEDLKKSEEVPTKVEEEQEIRQGFEVKQFGNRMEELRKVMEEYDKLASSWALGKKEKLAAKWHGIKENNLKMSLRNYFARIRNKYEDIHEIDLSTYDDFFRNLDSLDDFEKLRAAMSEFFNMNKLVETIAEGILEKRLKELEKTEADMRYLVKMYKVGYEKLMGYKQEGMEISEDQERQVKIDPEVLARLSEE